MSTNNKYILLMVLAALMLQYLSQAVTHETPMGVPSLENIAKMLLSVTFLFASVTIMLTAASLKPPLVLFALGASVIIYLLVAVTFFYGNRLPDPLANFTVHGSLDLLVTVVFWLSGLAMAFSLKHWKD
jgi:hypothetical protein